MYPVTGGLSELTMKVEKKKGGLGRSDTDGRRKRRYCHFAGKGDLIVLKKKWLLFIAALLLVALVAVPASHPREAVAAPAFAKGADISWVPGMEAQGYKWKDKNGVQRDIIDILK